MPRTASMGSSIDKTIRYIRKVHQNGEVSLKFTNYTSKNCIIYKLNKFHYLDSELYVIDMQAVREMAKVFKSSNNVELIHLDLCNIGDEEAIEFCKANWDNVRYLTLSNNKIKKRGVDALSKAKFAELKELSLSDNGLDADSIHPLSATSWKKLEKLNLSFNYLGGQGLMNLQANKWKSLKVLSLLSNGINNRGISYLVRMNFPCLDQLLLSHNQLTDDSAQLLLKGQWQQLKVLQLDDNFMGDTALKSLCRLGCYKLQKLNLFDGKTVIINNSKDAKVFATMGGLKQLAHSNFEHLKVEIHVGKLGEVSKSKFIKCTEVKDMLENIHVDIVLLNLNKSSC